MIGISSQTVLSASAGLAGIPNRSTSLTIACALGAFAAKTLLRSNDPISRLRGRVYEFRGAKLVPTFHPSFLLRSPNYKREAWEDLKRVRALLDQPA